MLKKDIELSFLFREETIALPFSDYVLQNHDFTRPLCVFFAWVYFPMKYIIFQILLMCCNRMQTPKHAKEPASVR